VIYSAINEKNKPIYQTESWLVKSQIISPKIKNNLPSIIIIHGYVGSPRDNIYIAKDLATVGYRVLCPVIPGQTANSPIFSRGNYSPSYYENWLKNIIANETLISGEKPILIGSSMGGTLSTIVAQNEIVGKVVLIAPFFSLPRANSFAIYISSIMRWLLPVIPKLSKGKINDPVGYSNYYPGSKFISLKAFLQLEKMALIAEKTAKKITIPALVIVSEGDQVASTARTMKVFENMKNVRIANYIKSNHILQYDYNRIELIKRIRHFVTSE
jgi:esterase/lipase